MSELGVLQSRRVGPAGAPTLLLLHSLAMDGSVWDGPLELLRDRYDVISCDLPGHGRSAPATELSIESMADAVAELLAGLGVSRTLVAGMSMGGCVAQQLAVRHRELVAGLLLADTTAWYGPDAPQRWQERALRARTEGFESLVDFQLTRWFSAEFRAGHQPLVQRLLATFQANDLDSYTSACHAMGSYDGRAELSALAVPALVLVGEHDTATPISDARDLGQRLGCEVRVIPSAGHMSPLERPELFAAAVDDLHGAAS